MKRSLGIAALSCLLFGAAFTNAGQAHAFAPSTDIKVQVNDNLVGFPDAQPFVDDSGHLLVPIRFVTEKMGCKVDWSIENQNVAVNVTGINKTINLKTGEAKARVGGKTVSLDSAAVFRDGRVFVPLRFIVESFGENVQWDDNNRIVIVDTDGKYHGPAWYAQKEAPAESTVSNLLNSAYQYKGTPYVWGGTEPDGFDCSGFVGYVFKSYGVDLPRTSQEMYNEAGGQVSDPKPGDLVFFSRSGAVYHVGIYVGNGSFISATKSKGVQVAPLFNGYWSSTYSGAKRIL